MTTPDDLREQAEDILSRREFSEATPSLADRFFDWLGDRLASIFERVGSLFPGGSGSVVSWIVTGLVVAGAVWIVVRAVRNRGPIEARSTDPLSLDVRLRHDEGYWLEQARQAEALGDYPAAVRAHYRAGMARLIDEGRLRDGPGATARQWRRDVADASQRESGALDEITSAFELVWFGGDAADPTTVEHVRNEAAKVGR